MKEMTYTVKVTADGNKFWYVKGKLHREDGPAVERVNGDKQWYVNNKLHRKEIKGTLQCSCSCCIRAFNVIEKANVDGRRSRTVERRGWRKGGVTCLDGQRLLD